MLTELSRFLDLDDASRRLESAQRVLMDDEQELLRLVEGLPPQSRELIKGLIKQLLPTTPENPDIDYGAELDRWLGYLRLRGRSPATLTKYSHVVRNLLKTFPHPTSERIEAYLAVKVAAGAAPGWLNIQISAFHSFFGYLAKRRKMADPSLTIERLATPQRERRIPTAIEVTKLLSVCDTKYRCLVLLMLDCGLRVGEVCGLRISALYLDRLEATLIGKGNKQRTVPMSSVTRDAIEGYLRVRKRNSAYLFPHRLQERPMYGESVQDGLGRLCAKAGIAHIAPHELRHFCASAMLEDGASLKVVSQILGHADPDVTAKVYWHVLEKDAKREEHKNHNPLKRLVE